MGLWVPTFGVSPFPLYVCVGRCRRSCLSRRRLRRRQRCGRYFFSFLVTSISITIPIRIRIPIPIRYCFARPLFCLDFSVFGFWFLVSVLIFCLFFGCCVAVLPCCSCVFFVCHLARPVSRLALF